MNLQIAFSCRRCETPQQVRLADPSAQTFCCPRCEEEYPLAAAIDAERLQQCVVCGCQELFVRKDFSQRLGVAIVVTGFVLSSIAWGMHQIYATYAILFATALIDVCLYLTVGNLLQCYRCSATYRGFSELGSHTGFSLETHEKFRQQAARLP